MKFTLHIGWKDVATVREPTATGRALKRVVVGDRFVVTDIRIDSVTFVKEGDAEPRRRRHSILSTWGFPEKRRMK